MINETVYVYSYLWAVECGFSKHWPIVYIYHFYQPGLMGWYYGKTLPQNANIFEQWALIGNEYVKVDNG